MPSVDERAENVRAYLNERFGKVSFEWIQSQLDASSAFTNEQIYQRYLEQDWNKKEIFKHLQRSLPSELDLNLLNIEKKIFTGKYLLQINHIVDVSKPLPSENLIENNLDNDENRSDSETENDNDFGSLFKKGKKSKDNKEKSGAFFRNGARMLQMSLFDGHQECIAIEYQPISCLNANLVGAKILLTGPFDVYMGTLLLRNKNVTLVSNVTFFPSDDNEQKDNNNDNHLTAASKPKPTEPILEPTSNRNDSESTTNTFALPTSISAPNIRELASDRVSSSPPPPISSSQIERYNSKELLDLFADIENFEPMDF